MNKTQVVLNLGRALRALLGVSTIVGLLAGPLDAQFQRPDMEPRLPTRPQRLRPQGAPPVGVRILATTQTTATLTWQAVPGATGYMIYRPGGIRVTATPLTSTSFKDSGLAPGRSYSWMVAALYPDKDQGVSAAVPGNTLPPVNPSGFQAKATAAGEVTLSWNPVAESSFYWLQGSGLSARQVSGTSYKVGGLSPGTHNYAIVAYYTSGGQNFADENNPVRTSVTIVPTVFARTFERDFGGGKHGKAHAVFDRSSGVLRVTTNTWTNSPLQGFTMGVKIYGVDQYGGFIFETLGGPGPYGVDGTAVGSASNRTDNYRQQFNPAEAAKVTDIIVLLFHAPKWRIVEIINQAAAKGIEITEAIREFCAKAREVCELAKQAVIALASG